MVPCTEPGTGCERTEGIYMGKELENVKRENGGTVAKVLCY